MSKDQKAQDTLDDMEAIRERRDALIRKFKRSAVAVTGAMLSATACPCLSPVPPDCSMDAGPQPGCPVPDAGTPDAGTPDAGPHDGGTPDGN